ncbi:MAG: hypothetical protein U0792_08500 [Gemmataceae bacterium]
MAAYQRACYLAADLMNCPNSRLTRRRGALRALRESCGPQSPFDPELLHSRATNDRGRAAGQGADGDHRAAAGILYGEGRLAEAEPVTPRWASSAARRPIPRRGAGFIRGLLATAREVAWQVAGGGALDARFGGWDEESFLGVLPELRLAFADLTPRETRVADSVAALHNTELKGPRAIRHIGGRCEARDAPPKLVRASLAADGLLGGERPA